MDTKLSLQEVTLCLQRGSPYSSVPTTSRHPPMDQTIHKGVLYTPELIENVLSFLDLTIHPRFSRRLAPFESTGRDIDNAGLVCQLWYQMALHVKWRHADPVTVLRLLGPTDVAGSVRTTCSGPPTGDEVPDAKPPHWPICRDVPASARV